MSKKHKVTAINIEKSVMEKINSEKITMRPRWYFILGTVLSLVGLVGSGLVAVFLTNLTIFLLKQHGPNGAWRLQQILESFPLWIPLLAVVGIVGGVSILKKYDFSYQKNFKSIVLMFISAILLVSFFLSYTGLDNLWMRQGPLHRFYEQNQAPNSSPTFRGNGRGGGFRQQNINSL